MERHPGIAVVALAACIASAVGCKKSGPPAAPPPPVVAVVSVGTRAIEQSQEWLATLDGSTNAEIRPQVAGYIKSVSYEEGSNVQKGALMFTLDRRPFIAAVERARGDYGNAVAQLNKSLADVRRYTPLAAEHAISQQDLDNAHAAAAAAAATVQAMKGALEVAKLNLEWAEVRSPITGLAGIAQARVGTLVNSSMVLTVVSTLDPIRASYSISERQYLQFADILNHVNEPQYANRRYLELVLVNGKVHPHGARRVVVNRQIDPTTGTLLVQVLFPNPDNILRPGMFSKVRLHTGRQENAVMVPEAAVQQLQGQARVALVDAQSRVQFRTIAVGRLIDHDYVVEKGLVPGERIIVEGLQNAQPGGKVTVQERQPKQAER
ncbi:MAG: efflux transporter, family, subunit [Myxococcales bacterium]|nr:efflux transporter, family, subunit [Myxococcales bacterium]